MKSIYFSIFIIFICLKLHAQVQYPAQLVIENVSFTSGNHNYFYPTDIISPSVSSSPVNFSAAAQVTYVAGYEVILKEGFTASGFNTNNGFFIAKTDTMKMVLIDPPAVSNDGFVHVPKWEKFEVGFVLPTEYLNAVNSFLDHYYTNTVNVNTDLNPYADDSLKFEVTLISPSSIQHTKWAFFMKMARFDSASITAVLEEDVDNPLYPYKFRLRFAPDEENSTVPWSFSIVISGPAGTNFPAYTFSGFQFICDPPLTDNKGFLHLNTNNTRYLQFDNGDGFFGIGENIADHRSNLGYAYHKSDYDNINNTLDEMHDAGANYVRLWCSKWDFTPEFNNLGVYDSYDPPGSCGSLGVPFPPGNRQWQLWTLDNFFEKMRNHNIYTQLMVEAFAPLPAYHFWWGEDIYLRTFVTDYDDGVTSDFTVEDYFGPDTYYWRQRRFKYILNRYGYSVNLAAIETFNEIDQTFQYRCIDTAIGICSSYKHPWPEEPNVKSSIEDWHDEILSYIKSPVSAGGLGFEFHPLLTVSYTGSGLFSYNATANCSAYTASYSDYYSLFGNSNIDITDIHIYDDNPWNDSYKWELCNGDVGGNGNIRQYFGKPFHVGEGANVWYAGGNDVSSFYNNYDISFHNELWSSAFSGTFTTSLSFYYQLIHRWGYFANPNPPSGTPYPNSIANDLEEPFIFFLGTPQQVNDTIRSYYHNYKRLSEFININEIDFNIDFTPFKVYDPVDGNIHQNIECYYLSNLSYAYGWIHNINSFMGNAYYYTSSAQNYYGCTVPTITMPLQLEGFYPNQDYTVSYFYTRMGSQPILFPQMQTITADGSGILSIPTSVLDYLGCDSVNADFAFSAIEQPQLRLIPSLSSSRDSLGKEQPVKKVKAKAKTQLEFGFTIFPNPGTGIFNIYIKGIDLINSSGNITVYDMTGRIVFQKIISKKSFASIDLSLLIKGCYLIEVTISSTKKFNKIILQ
ncbi:MAG TPA: T9SS type A sorting domain-containing protein [Bacteroidia bacterium]|nr:T9SS type A sorting domain-containing protein [Bacteroidia bacterium]